MQKMQGEVGDNIQKMHEKYSEMQKTTNCEELLTCAVPCGGARICQKNTLSALKAGTNIEVFQQLLCKDIYSGL